MATLENLAVEVLDVSIGSSGGTPFTVPYNGLFKFFNEAAPSSGNVAVQIRDSAGVWQEYVGLDDGVGATVAVRLSSYYVYRLRPSKAGYRVTIAPADTPPRTVGEFLRGTRKLVEFES